MYKRRRKASKYDGKPLERLVELLSKDPRPSIRDAALTVAREQSAEDDQRYAESLRKHHRTCKQRGEIPDDSEANMLTALEEVYGSRERTFSHWSREYARLSKEAQQRFEDLELTKEGIQVLLIELRSKRASFAQVAGGGDIAIDALLQSEFATPEEAHQEYLRQRKEWKAADGDYKLIGELFRRYSELEQVNQLPQNGEAEI